MSDIPVSNTRCFFKSVRLSIDLDWKYPFWANMVQKNQNHLCKMKFGTEYNLSMMNMIVMFTFSVLDWKHLFWANLVQKIKFICLRWNLVHRLIQIFGIRWSYLFFLFWIGNALFGKISSTLSKLLEAFV